MIVDAGKDSPDHKIVNSKVTTKQIHYDHLSGTSTSPAAPEGVSPMPAVGNSTEMMATKKSKKLGVRPALI